MLPLAFGPPVDRVQDAEPRRFFVSLSAHAFRDAVLPLLAWASVLSADVAQAVT